MNTTPHQRAAAWNYFMPHPTAASTPPHDNRHSEVPTEDLRASTQRPTTGRTSVTGRRVEKPGTGRSSGPSGQPDEFRHGLIHTNK
ncbi:MAG: hypothetical protein V4684_08025 [Pseudomonadota bacterium]